MLAAATGATPVMVRGRQGHAVEWIDGDRAELSLVWQESAEQWFELRAYPRVPLQVDLGDGRLLVVQSAVRAPLPEADLIRFAAGITVAPAAVPGKG